MAFIPTEEEILSKSDINWIINGEAGDESITNRPTNDVANFVNTVKEYAIFTDPSKKNLTEQTISSPLKLNSYLGLHGGETGGIRFFNVGDENDSASISLTKDLEGNQFLKISSLNDAGDKIQFEVTDKDSIKVLLKNGTTVETSKIFHSGNHGKNSGLDADKIHGVYPASSNNVNAVVQRNSSGNFSANEITANKFLGDSTNVTGIVAAVNGGTGFSSFTCGDILIAKDSDEFEKIPLGDEKAILISTGRASKPAWRRLKADDFLDSEVIPIKNGGTGVTSSTGTGNVVFSSNPVFEGTPTAPTASVGTNTAQLATTAFVMNAAYSHPRGDGHKHIPSGGAAGQILRYSGEYGTAVWGADVDTNTWRGIQNNLTSDSTSDSLSAKQGKVLKDSVDILRTSLSLKADIASPTFTGTVSGISKSMVGLGSVDNTSDVDKPVSTAQATAIGLKANIASPTFTGIPKTTTAAFRTNTTQIASTAYVDNLFSWDGSKLKIQVADGVWKQVFPPVYA